jgi:hypothetical protein
MYSTVRQTSFGLVWTQVYPDMVIRLLESQTRGGSYSNTGSVRSPDYALT